MNLQQIIETNSIYMDHCESYDEVLKKFILSIENSNKPILEVGVNKGGSTLCLMDVLFNLKKNNWLISVDPYGEIPYHNGASVINTDSGYSNSKYRNTMQRLYGAANDLNINYQHVKLTSEQFIEAFPSFRIYDAEYSSLDKFSFIYLDGSHDPAVVIKELQFFSNHLEVGGSIIVDDYVEARFKGFWEEFFVQHPELCRDKTSIKDKCVLEYR